MINRHNIVKARQAFEAWGFRASYYFPKNERNGSPPILEISEFKENSEDA